MRLSVGIKLILGFSTILLMLIFIAFQSITNYRATSITLNNLVSISDGVLGESNKVKTTLLTAIADFKRISEKENSRDINAVVSKGKEFHSAIRNSLQAIEAQVEGHQALDISDETRQLNQIVGDMWQQMESAASYRLQQIEVEQKINAWRLELSEIEITLSPYFEALFWEAQDDQSLLLLYDFYSSFLTGLNIIKNFDAVTTSQQLEAVSGAYQSWQALHLEYFLEMASLAAEIPSFREATRFLVDLTDRLDNIILSEQTGSLGLTQLYGQTLSLSQTNLDNLAQIESVIAEVLVSVEQLTEEVNLYSKGIAAEMDASINAGINILWLISAGAVVVAVVISLWMLRSIRLPMARVIEALAYLCDGDLRYRFTKHTQDEFGELSTAAEKVNTQLASMVGDIVDKSDSLRELMHATDELTDRALNQVQRQADELSSVAASMQEMTYTVTEVSNSASVAKDEVVTIIALSNNADDGMQNSQQSVSQLRGHLDSAVTVIGDMNTAVGNIEQILTVIGAIAEQTNLLALNAAIEAARAGEHGRGFAVVADEVRSLANRTQSSTSEIQSLIAGLNSAVSRSVNVIEESSSMANSSDQQFSSLAKIFVELNKSIEKLSESSDHIASIALDQSKTAEEINQQVNAISDAAEETRGEVSRVSENVLQIDGVSSDLRGMITEFKVK